MKKKALDSNKKKIKVLDSVKKHIIFDGWNKKIFDKAIKDSNLSKNELFKLFPKGHVDLLKFYINESEKNMMSSSKKLNFTRTKTSERISEIINLRLKKNIDERELVYKTFKYLKLPQNAKLGLKSLYNTVDNIWYLAGDNSTDFNFYTKRLILAGIYTTTLIFWFNDRSENQIKTKEYLFNKLKKTSIIPKVKNSLGTIIGSVPKIRSILKNLKN